MKKLITTIIAVSAMAAMSVSAFAIETEDITGDTQHDVQVRYDDSTSETIYSVDITWGAMKFNYNAGTWDPSSHNYIGGDSKGYTPAEEGADKVTITNHTNKEIEALVEYTKDDSHGEIEGAVTPNDLTFIASAVGTTVKDAPSQEFSLGLAGEPAEQLEGYTKVGELTVTLS